MKHTLFLVIPLLLIAGCGDYRYIPTTVKPTFFTGKGDMEVSLNAMYMGELHAGYAITDHLAIAGTTSGIYHANDTNWTTDSAFNKIGFNSKDRRINDNELSLGIYHCFQDGTTVELYGGFGVLRNKFNISHVEYNNPSQNYQTNTKELNYRRYFIQPAIGKTTNITDFGYANRISYLVYNNPGSTRQYDLISESVFFTRIGYKYVKFMMQFGFTLTSAESNYDYFPFTLGFGLYFQLNKLRHIQ